MFNLLKKACLIAAVLLLSACHSKQASAPQGQTALAPNTAANPAPALAAPPGAPTQPVAAAAPLDGEWKGDIGDKDMPVSFTVKGNQLTKPWVSSVLKKGGCSYTGSYSIDATAPINGKGFSFKAVHDDDFKNHFEVTMSGTFTSDKEASGTFHWVGNSNLCGPIDAQTNWTAKKGAGEGSDTDAGSKENDND
jgi:hypothetical protein